MCYEYNLIILLSKPCLNKQEKNIVNTIIRKTLDWEVIYDNIQRHRIAPIVYHHIKTNILEKFIPKEILNYLTKEFEANKLKQEIYFKELRMIFEKFKNRNIKYCILKGVVLQKLLYPEYARFFNDIDVLICKNDYLEVLKILNESNFSNQQDLGIEKNKRERLFLLLNTYEFPEFQKEVIVNNQNIKLYIDVQHMHTLAKKMRYDINTSEELQCCEEIVVGDVKFNRQRLDYLLIHMCTHTFGDCTTISEILLKKAFRLKNFADIVSLVEKYSYVYLSNDFQKLVKKTNTARPVYYCLYHCMQIFQTTEVFAKIVRKIGSLLSDYNFLEQCGFENGIEGVITWETPLIDKIFSKEGIKEVKEKSKKSIEKYVCYDTRFETS